HQYFHRRIDKSVTNHTYAGLPARHRLRLPRGTRRASAPATMAAMSAPAPITEATAMAFSSRGGTLPMASAGIADGGGSATTGTLADSYGSTAVTASTGLTMPAPVPAPAVPSAVAMMRRRTCSWLRCGKRARTRAAVPATYGAA